MNWGIGVTFDEKGVYVSYGYPVTDNPHLFTPDPEMCNADEFQEWLKAKEAWDEK